MTAASRRPAIISAGLLLGLLAVISQGVQCEEIEQVPSEDQCRPYIEKALKDFGAEGSEEQAATDSPHEDGEEGITIYNDDTLNVQDDDKSGQQVSVEETSEDKVDEQTVADDEELRRIVLEQINSLNEGAAANAHSNEDEGQSTGDGDSGGGDDSKESGSGDSTKGQANVESIIVVDGTLSQQEDKDDESFRADRESEQQSGDGDTSGGNSAEGQADGESIMLIDESSSEHQNNENDHSEADRESEQQFSDSDAGGADSAENQADGEVDPMIAESSNELDEPTPIDAEGLVDISNREEQVLNGKTESLEEEEAIESEKIVATSIEQVIKANEMYAGDTGSSDEEAHGAAESGGNEMEGESEEIDDKASSPEEEDLIMEIEIPEVLRPRDHIGQLLKLDEENEGRERAVEKVADVALKDLKKLYDNAIKPLETLYKYRDLSNRHFGDPEIFSKPLVLFMGPWSGGKSSIINYLLDIEYKATSLRTGAEPSPAHFNIVMHGEEEEMLDGTQLAADWTFSGLQKFGQGLLDRLRGYKLKNKLLEKVNIVEIPGILEIRKQVQRLFPFNDACQWFIDRADIIFLVYDPSKLDVGPETEAILDQLKGREYQTRIILNKADQVKPEELMRVQGALIWNISPLMSSAEPPIMYSTSLWSVPYEAGAPTRLLYAQERAFLRDLRSAVDKRVEHKIASARRFAVRVRNHAKMVDCYLTTYYNHKSLFAKKKDVAERIIENPQDYHIYEGLSTLTNISRYDLPDPDVYRDFFRLNNLYEFPLLSSTCTYFRGCPINRLDVAIAYDLPELVGKYKKSAEAAAAAVHAVEKEVEAVVTAQPATAAQVPMQKANSGASTVSLS